MTERFDVLVLGAGPSGHRAALTAANAGKRVAIVEQDAAVGGACVTRGTIPSKTLRETALAFSSFAKKTGGVLTSEVPEDVRVVALMKRVGDVVSAHERVMGRQLAAAGVVVLHGRARFVARDAVELRTVRGERRRLESPAIVIATGSRPRSPAEIPIDHEHILDSDSILSLAYLPRSLIVLGAGVIASEYASIFAALGVAVTMVDKAPRPVPFVEPELTARFVEGFTENGGRFIGGRKPTRVEWNGVDHVSVVLDDGTELVADKVLCALGRVANLDGLALEAAGLAPNERGLLVVDEHCRTSAPGIWAIGDVIGPPSLAASATEQGRCAVVDALGLEATLPTGIAARVLPTGVYSIPEMASVGLNEADARARDPNVLVGRASFAEITRGMIAATEGGFLKLVATADGQKLLGAHVVGEGASELVGIGQLAIQAGLSVDQLVETIFNFPTLAEAYRVAALDVVHQRAKRAG
jgi:NAD(P) transhydrogenase